ncbi:hypothetical protein Aspvir_006545 [Aspergillus viridinutans]|uniref:RBR-type E3 ubiquitin transferase n=1 Tax=Aspergillus viridinutans TaxID=75553 RepID=A0A9P3F2F2_ASPVI|nr:uncharacterized protein Aspvir_006545 [Aspergillus viridinutans]GIK02489.1 hypothetical protein Aspvir_006545 [Aspergillus viridinutans]
MEAIYHFDRMSIDETVPAAPTEAPAEVPAEIRPCAYCSEDIEGEQLRPCKGCGCYCCTDCIRQIFLMACKDEAQMPPRCCQPIPLAVARRYLSDEEIALYKLKFEEWRTVNRCYCPVPTCSVFIPPSYIQQQWKNLVASSGFYRQLAASGATPSLPVSPLYISFPVLCPKCFAQVCWKCKKLYHHGSMCQVSDIDPELARALEKLGIKRCPKCRAAVRRMFGCRHMQCRCGAQWCWYCCRAIEVCKANICAKARAAEIDVRDDNAEEIATQVDEGEAGEEEDGEEDEDAEGDSDDEDYWDRYGGWRSDPDETDDEGDDQAEYEDDDDEDQEPEMSLARAVQHNHFAAEAGSDVDLDARSDWEENSDFFGTEPDSSRLDPFDCNHDFAMIIDNSEVENSEYEYECENCWRRIFPRETLIPGSLWEQIQSEDTSPTAQLIASMNVVERSDAQMYLCRNCKFRLCGPCRAGYGNFEF